MIVLWIIIGIVAVAFFVGIIAVIVDLVKPKNKHKPFGPYERFVKRGLDAFLATGAFIVFSPILFITAIAVRIKLGAPVIFTQDRPGINEKNFRLYKFRSMTNEKDENGKLCSDDVRLTKFGRFLRSTSLDELPELLNIIKGDMAVVGPRPLLTEYIPYYTEEEHHRHDVRPGLTGLAQINGRNNISWDQKLSFDVQYVSRITFLGDTKIVVNTFVKTVKRSDIQVGSEFKAGKFIDQRIERLEKDNAKKG